MPFAPIVSVLTELDRRTGLLDRFTHAGGAAPRSRELKRNLLAVLIGQATNLGLSRMADASGIAYDTLAWTQEWYLREETLRAANLALVGYHQQLPLAAIFGGGTPSSSDGQRFPTKGEIDHRPRPEPVFRGRGAELLHPRHRPARGVRHQSHRGHRPRGAVRAG